MIGTRIGQYRVLQPLGEGGMGRVLLCEHAVIGTRHAVKMLHDEFSKNDVVVQRFLNEARAASAIGHRNVIEITHADQVDEQGPWYLVMKYLTGQTLSAFLASRTAHVDQRLIVHVIGEALNGLQAAHDRRIVHRDLKPDNLFLTSTKDDPIRTILLDFGIAQLGREAGVVTATGSVMGTPQYMAPEQHRGAHIDHRVDLWAIGAIVYEMATGRLPYQDDGEPRDKLTGAEIFYRMMSRPLVDPRCYNPSLTEDFVKATTAALAIDPDRRPASARAAALAWAEATPGDADAPSGIEILKTYAEELLQGDNLLETMRSPPPSMDVVSRYEIGARLGEGGMAEVFMATVRGVEGFARPVALKRVLTGFSELPQFAAMFIEEARIAMRLVHENVVSVIDFSRDDAGRFFLVMEYVAGKDLSAIIETGALPPSVAVFITTKMLRGLGYAHELPLRATNTRGVIHRDVSPQNVLISWQGAVKVSDFGLAKARDATGAVRSLMLKGKPSYMSPEQANSEALDPRSDLFAVGVVLWEMLSGRRLFEGDKEAVFTKIFLGKIPSLRSIGIRVSSRLDRVVSKLLARNRGDRYPSAAHALEALTSCPEHPRDGVSELVRLLATRFPSETQTLPPLGPQPRMAAQMTAPQGPMSTLGATASQSIPAARPSRTRRAWIIAPVVLLGVVTATAVLVSRPGHPGEAASRSQVPSGPGSSDARISPRAPRSPETATASVQSAPGGAVDARAQTAAVAPAPPDAAVAAATPVVAASIEAAPPATTGRLGQGPLDAGVPDAAVIAAPQPPTAHDPATADAGSNAPGAAPVGMGRLKIVILPWAEAWLDGKSLGQTPIVGLKVAAGVHRIRLKNDNKEKIVTVTVTTSKPTVIDETW